MVKGIDCAPGSRPAWNASGGAHVDGPHRTALLRQPLQRVSVDGEHGRAPRMAGRRRPAEGQQGEQRQADRTHRRHGLFTVTVMLAVPVAFVESRTVTTSVRWPFGVFVVTHGSATCALVELSLQTVEPPTVIVYALLPAAAPSTQILTHTVPLTVAPGVGVVSATRKVPADAFETVTVRVADAEPPAASVMVRPSV